MNRYVRISPVLLALVTFVNLSQPANAWWPKGHSIIAGAAIRILAESKDMIPVAKPDPMPGFFREGHILVAHTAQDPDTLTTGLLDAINNREAPDHYINFEMLEGHPLPPTRSEFVKLCQELKIDPSQTGYAPYAIAEWTQRLTMAFAEYRRWPKNASLKTKCLVYAGLLSHYSADLCMPLHTTINYDGMVQPDGATPHSGIHKNVDAVIERLDMTAALLAKDQSVAPLPELMPGIVAELTESRSHITETYDLEKVFPEGRVALPNTAVAAYAMERGRESARFTAALFVTAWHNSSKITLPDWLDRSSD